MATNKPQTTLGPWTMSVDQAAALQGTAENPGLFARAGLTLEQAIERWSRVDGWKIVSIVISMLDEASEAESRAKMAGKAFTRGGDSGGQLGFLMRLHVAAQKAGLDMVTNETSVVLARCSSVADNPADRLLVHDAISNAILWFETMGVELPPRPERKESASNGDANTPGDSPSVQYPSKG